MSAFLFHHHRTVDFSTVHSDILFSIFSQIHIRPRILVVSRVCKRWRQAVLRCPTSLIGLHLLPAALTRACASLLMITEIACTTPLHSMPYLPHVTSLITLPRPCASESYHLFTGLANLNLCIDNQCTCAIQLIKGNASTLTTLQLRGGMSASHTATIKAIAALSLPRLRNLRLHFSKNRDSIAFALGDFLHHHSGQLTSLALSLPLFGVFSSLHSLELSYESLDVRSFSALLRNAPRLVDLSLELSTANFDAPNLQQLSSLIVDKLVRFKCSFPLQQQWLAWCPVLDACSRLTSLDIDREPLLSDSLRTRLVSLSVSHVSSLLPYATWSNLCSLTASLTPSYRLKWGHGTLSLPALQRFSIRLPPANPTTSSDLLLVLQEVLDSCPLRSLEVVSASGAFFPTTWTSFLLAAEKRGLDWVTVTFAKKQYELRDFSKRPFMWLQFTNDTNCA